MEEKAQTPPAKKIALQVLLPLFPVEATMINSLVAVQKKAETVYYFNGSMPIFKHIESDGYSTQSEPPVLRQSEPVILRKVSHPCTGRLSV